MNYKSNVQLVNVTNNQVNTFNKLGCWLQTFWQFSCFYADYRAKIYLKKNY
jgi:hypothetical protein